MTALLLLKKEQKVHKIAALFGFFFTYVNTNSSTLMYYKLWARFKQFILVKTFFM